VSAQQDDAERTADLFRRHVNRTWAVMMGGRSEHSASGSYVYSSQGERYLDCGGHGVLLLGHSHPAVVSAVIEQLGRQALPSRFLLSPIVAEAAARLIEVAPPGLEYVFFGTSGSDAVEIAIKLARLSGRSRVIAMRDGFHGKTMGALSVTGRDQFRQPFAPLLPQVEHVPFGDLLALRRALVAARGQACVFVEPIQAEAGVILPPPGYLARVAEACREHDALLVLDEIQTGLGRTGSWWAAQGESVVPDILLAGKILSGGVVPVSAVLATTAVFEPINHDPILHSATFANSPIAAAAAKATIDVIEQDGLVDRSRVLGERLLDIVTKTLQTECPGLVRAVRGSGLLIGIEFAAEASVGEFVFEMFRQSVICNFSLNAHSVVRLTPSAYLSDDDVTWLTEALSRSAVAVAERTAMDLQEVTL
jgi:putrescine aminotransferase